MTLKNSCSFNSIYTALKKNQNDAKGTTMLRDFNALSKRPHAPGYFGTF